MLLEGGVANATQQSSGVPVESTSSYGTGATPSTSVDFTVGLTVGGEIIVSCVNDSVSDTAAIPGITGGTAVIANTCNVKTNSETGWQMWVNSTATAAMQWHGTDYTTNFFTDYTEASAGVPETWTTASATAEFGFSATGTYKLAIMDGDKYQGFSGLTKIKVSQNSTETDTTGVDTVFGFKAQIQDSFVRAGNYMKSGWYRAPVTVTGAVQ
ncbi:hypothetical protein KKA13_00935 [Patescibacteria group bacterium]|nr:hypothetical protein [Patescibacteria group bacterium]